MDQFGVQKESLKTIARTPVIPGLNANQKTSSQDKALAATDIVWLGATLEELYGDAFSAFGVSKDDGGIAVMKVPANSEATRMGLQEKDVIQKVNGETVPKLPAFLRALARVGPGSLQLKVVRGQQAMELRIEHHAYVRVETAGEASDFKQLPLPTAPSGTLIANTKTNNDPLQSLVDGKLASGYGPVFGNGVYHGAYKMDLGEVQRVKAISSWSFKQGQRGAQSLTLYGSRSTKDPGWNLKTLTPIGTVDTAAGGSTYTAASLRAATGQTLGAFRWIIWRVSLVNAIGGGENTAFQELDVEFAGEN
ncbi:MAG: PDZ domain-containing protein [Fuerstiella sp.]|nr:PDZ domain-containing protein [Fuerstiella sp.]